jgi:hypothetical protein
MPAQPTHAHRNNELDVRYTIFLRRLALTGAVRESGVNNASCRFVEFHYIHTYQV